MEPKGILYLSNEDVRQVLDLGSAIDITEQALRDHSEGRIIWSTPEDFATYLRGLRLRRRALKKSLKATRRRRQPLSRLRRCWASEIALAAKPWKS